MLLPKYIIVEEFLILFVKFGKNGDYKMGELVSQRNAKRVAINITLLHETKKSLFNVSL